jgi:hypothetical protein
MNKLLNYCFLAVLGNETEPQVDGPSGTSTSAKNGTRASGNKTGKKHEIRSGPKTMI